MSETEGLRITISQEVSVQRLADLIVSGLHYHEIESLIHEIVNAIGDDEFTDAVVARIQ